MKKIIEFQKESGLAADGIIGAMTLNALGNRLGLSKIRLSNFMGQLHHETGGFKYDTESLNYSVTGLKKTFSYYRSHPMEAWADGRSLIHKADQETIANKVYWDNNRERSHWLGNKSWGDGWKFRGRGAIYWESALWFFEKKSLWKLADSSTIKSITQLTKAINGGLNGIDDRIRMTRYYANLLGV